jgi:hypothetical protein
LKLIQKGFQEREVSAMFYPLDIFKTYSDGSVIWRGAAETLIAAKAYIKELAASSPGQYLVLDQSTGSRVLVIPGVVGQHDS